MIITVSGVDCAGKSTHIEYLRQYFISQGKTCTVFWYRPGYSRELQKIKDIMRYAARCACSIKGALKPIKAGCQKSVQPEQTDKSAASTSKPKVPAPLWLTSAMIDSIGQWALKLRYLERRYDVVICDRYVRDAVLDLVFKYPEYLWSESIFKAIAKAFPKPDCSILMWLPYDVMVERAERKNEPFPDEPHVRELRWHAYDDMGHNGESEGISLVDASGSIEETRQKILDIVNPLMTR